MSSALHRKLQLYAPLSGADHGQLSNAMRQTRHVNARTDIAVEGDDPRTMYIILHGWAGRCRHLRDGRRQITSLLLPGDCCDPHVFLFHRRDHTITALTPVVIASIPGPAFKDLVAQSPVLESAFFYETMIAGSIQREVAVSLGRRSGLERLAHLLCELHTRQTAVALAEGQNCLMPLNQGDLADALGQTPVHINRMLQELRRLGLISLRQRHLTIHDADGLAELAHFDSTYLHALDTAQKGEN
jgi:CRP-like cAMP-binding protein